MQLRQLKDPISAYVEAVSRLLLSVLSVAVNINLLEEEIVRKGAVGGK